LLILNGVSEITEYLDINEEKDILPVISHSTVQNNNFTFTDNKEGCEIDFLKKELENCK